MAKKGLKRLVVVTVEVFFEEKEQKIIFSPGIFFSEDIAQSGDGLMKYFLVSGPIGGT